MVRRDWCALAKDCGNYALDEILSGRPCEDVLSAIHARLRQVPNTVIPDMSQNRLISCSPAMHDALSNLAFLQLPLISVVSCEVMHAKVCKEKLLFSRTSCDSGAVLL